jgi:hypothetical protein
MTAYVDELIAEALIAAPGCPETVVERMLRTACVAFYRETFAWRLTTDPLFVRRGYPLVELDVEADLIPCRVYWATLAGESLTAIALQKTGNCPGTPRGYAFAGFSRELYLDRAPERNYSRDGLVVHLAVAPTNTRDDLPRELFDAHRDGILFGAQSRLLAMPNVTWGDLNGSMLLASMADAEKAKARREAQALQAPVVRVVKYGGI